MPSKRIMVILFILFGLLVVVACGSEPEAPTAEETAAEETAVEEAAAEEAAEETTAEETEAAAEEVASSDIPGIEPYPEAVPLLDSAEAQLKECELNIFEEKCYLKIAFYKLIDQYQL